VKFIRKKEFLREGGRHLLLLLYRGVFELDTYELAGQHQRYFGVTFHQMGFQAVDASVVTAVAVTGAGTFLGHT
jgi:hypothetical protein